MTLKWWAVGDLESPLPAFFWHTGLIAMLWQAPAFRLLFWQHLHVQSAATIEHALLLAEAVCDTLPDVSYGPDLVSMGHRVLQALGSAWDLFTFVVTGDATAFLDHASQEGSSAVGPQPAAAAAGSIASLPPAAAAAVDSTSGVSSGGPGSKGACLLVVWCWQFLVGNLLIGAVLYWLEAADRARWWQKHFSRPQEQPQPSQPPQPPSEEQRQQREQGAILCAYCSAFLLCGVGLVGLLVAGGSLMALVLF